MLQDEFNVDMQCYDANNVLMVQLIPTKRYRPPHTLSPTPAPLQLPSSPQPDHSNRRQQTRDGRYPEGQLEARRPLAPRSTVIVVLSRTTARRAMSGLMTALVFRDEGVKVL